WFDGTEAKVIARDQPAHAVPNEIEARRGITRSFCEFVQIVGEAAGGFDKVAPPVVAEHVISRVTVKSCTGASKPRRPQQLEQIAVLREPEQPWNETLGTEQTVRDQAVATRAERKYARQTERVRAHGVAPTEPDARSIPADQATSHDAGYDDDGGQVLA